MTRTKPYAKPIYALLALALALGLMLVPAAPVFAAALTGVTNTPTDTTAGATTTHTVAFTTVGALAVAATTDQIIITYPAGFDASGAAVDATTTTPSTTDPTLAGVPTATVVTLNVAADEAAGAFSIVLTGIVNHTTAAAYTVSVETQDGDGGNIDGPTDSAAFTITAGVATQVLVETAADGTGTVVPAQNVASGSAITVYSITRDVNDNFVLNEAADTWSLVNKTVGVVDGDLVPAGDSKSATFTGALVGTADIHAVEGALTSVDSGTLTVIPGAAATAVVTANPTTITANGVETSVITATVTDANGNNVADGTAVNFTTTLGALSSAAANTTAGVATVNFSSTTQGMATVTATCGAATGTSPIIYISPSPTVPPPPPAAAPSPAAIMVQYLSIQPSQTNSNQPVTISANITNRGGTTGSYTANLMINGQVEDTKAVTVPPNSAVRVTFAVHKAEPGTYNVSLAGEQGNFTVLGGGSSGGGLSSPLIIGIVLIFVAVFLGILGLIMRTRRT